MRGWLDTFSEAFVRPLAPGDRPAFLDAVVTRLAPLLRDGEGNWTADYTRLRFVAVKPHGARHKLTSHLVMPTE